jgi:hypothetical protein
MRGYGAIFSSISMTEDQSNPDVATLTWQRVPAEERKAVVALAQAQALGSCLTLLALGATAAWALKMPTLLLATGVITPVVFQAIFTRAWTRAKPRAIAEYLAAEHTARHFAKILQAPHTGVNFLFRATAEQARERLNDSEESQPHKQPTSTKIPVWVSLFPESLLMVTEGKDGAKLVFAHSTVNKFRSSLPQLNEENTLPPALILETEEHDGNGAQWILSSPHPRTLETCQERILMFAEQAQAQRSKPRRGLELR